MKATVEISVDKNKVELLKKNIEVNIEMIVDSSMLETSKEQNVKNLLAVAEELIASTLKVEFTGGFIG
jgi:hypothetical protein